MEKTRVKFWDILNPRNSAKRKSTMTAKNNRLKNRKPLFNTRMILIQSTLPNWMSRKVLGFCRLIATTMSTGPIFWKMEAQKIRAWTWIDFTPSHKLDKMSKRPTLTVISPTYTQLEILSHQASHNVKIQWTDLQISTTRKQKAKKTPTRTGLNPWIRKSSSPQPF